MRRIAVVMAAYSPDRVDDKRLRVRGSLSHQTRLVQSDIVGGLALLGQLSFRIRKILAEEGGSVGTTDIVTRMFSWLKVFRTTDARCLFLMPSAVVPENNFRGGVIPRYPAQSGSGCRRNGRIWLRESCPQNFLTCCRTSMSGSTSTKTWLRRGDGPPSPGSRGDLTGKGFDLKLGPFPA